MSIFFSGRLLTASDLGAEQAAAVRHHADPAAPLAASDLQAGTSGAVAERSQPGSRFDAVALNPQPLPPKDINELVQWVLRESYTSTTADLRFYLEKAASSNDAKKQARHETHHASEANGTGDPNTKALERKAKAMDDDVQSANNLHLQDALPQQRTLKALSDLSKQEHDPAMSSAPEPLRAPTPPRPGR